MGASSFYNSKLIMESKNTLLKRFLYKIYTPIKVTNFLGHAKSTVYRITNNYAALERHKGVLTYHN